MRLLRHHCRGPLQERRARAVLPLPAAKKNTEETSLETRSTQLSTNACGRKQPSGAAMESSKGIFLRHHPTVRLPTRARPLPKNPEMTSKRSCQSSEWGSHQPNQDSGQELLEEGSGEHNPRETPNRCTLQSKNTCPNWSTLLIGHVHPSNAIRHTIG
ncbi:hypothetical protein EVAR_749_1 [Eumeta japonica]|uniref:Uncharacterized protein n=1 Tax=Eumeta variegata TaxID=151549 RepID=A0A4C1SBR9_EUMVA|nr:hypothetical protein EVAR_749_1 [Eumeta japonica]